MTDLLDTLIRVPAVLLPAVVWIAWWLWAVNWKKLAPILAQGGWAPAGLLFLMAAVAWSRVDPAPCSCVGLVLPSFVWQLGCVAVLAAVALFCGWLQGRLRCGPTEISLEPPALAEDGHGHAH